jgi:hypothetical protein
MALANFDGESALLLPPIAAMVVETGPLSLFSVSTTLSKVQVYLTRNGIALYRPLKLDRQATEAAF